MNTGKKFRLVEIKQFVTLRKKEFNIVEISLENVTVFILNVNSLTII